MQTYTLLPLFWRALRCALLLVLLFLIVPLALSARTPDRRAPSGEDKQRAPYTSLSPRGAELAGDGQPYIFDPV
ncbi:MAG: hypothetical protein H2172_15115 [Opitutus sp.]|nr:hypothetical protein [Opitutus sp.]MCS6247868.1 hypothetical protein [Opitutus sp.]MCS6275396.1 hypothetical protein [Opitutus sp.]MCS6301396.1 hypothetical protein [Opitutus sp.]